MDLSELDFLAEQEKVTVVPNFSYSKLYFIRGECGPFTAGLPSEVPLWLAINLRQRQKCRILPPDWMTTERLEEIKQEETDSSSFTAMPSNCYMEFSQLLFDVAVNDIHNTDEIRTLIKDIWDIRMAKLRSSVDAFIKSGESHAQVDNLTMFEINFARPLLTAALFQLQKLTRESAVSTNDSQNLSQSLSQQSSGSF